MSLTPEILSMEVDVENKYESEYRVRVGRQIRYVKVAPGTFDSDTLSFPVSHFPTLPFHDRTWTVAHISRDAQSGQLKTLFSREKLAAVQNVWHSAQIDVQDLRRTEQLTAAVYEAVLPTPTTAEAKLPDLMQPGSTVVVAKNARFEWEMPRIERETRAYQFLHQHHVSGIAPRFLGHIHEEGRVIGFLLEKLENHRPACIDDLQDCCSALSTFHALGLLHGDVNRYNFLVGASGVKLVDFERFVEDAPPEAQSEEMKSVRTELSDVVSGRGGGFMFVDTDE